MTPFAPATPKQRRADRQATTSRALAAALDRHGVSRALLAAHADAPEQHARGWADPEVDRNIPVHALCAAPILVKVDLCEHVLGEGYVVATVPPALDEISDDVRAIARIAHGGNVVVAKHLAGIADGVLDRGEIADIVAAVDAHQRALAALKLRLLQAEAQLGCAVVRDMPRRKTAGAR